MLKIVVFFLAFTILVGIGFSPILLSRVMDSTKYEDVMGNDNLYLGLIIIVEIYVITFSAFGLFGAIRPSKGCLIWYLIFLVQALLFSLSGLAIFLGLFITQESSLENFCKDGSFVAYRDQIKNYDD